MEPIKKSEENFARLQEEHERAIEVSRERIQKWEKFKADYEALQTRLHTLPDRVSHDIMVPLGRFAFMPGKLYHTNEILVLLGDNWFAKRSAKQATEIAERRRQYVAKLLEEEAQQFSDWEARHAFTADIRSSMEEHEGTVEIREEYNPEEEEKRRRARRERRQKESKVQVPPPMKVLPTAHFVPTSITAKEDGAKHEKKGLFKPSSAALTAATTGGSKVDTKELPTSTVTKGGGCRTDEEVWARLDELEKDEEELLRRAREEERELRTAGETQLPGDGVAPEKAGEKLPLKSEKLKSELERGGLDGTQTAERRRTEPARVQKKQLTEGQKSEEMVVREKSFTRNASGGPSREQNPLCADLEGSNEEEDRGICTHGPLRITVTHTKIDEPPAAEDSASAEDRETRANALFTSPADIFRFFCKPHISEESEEEPKLGAGESEECTTPKSVRWDPNLVSYSNEGRETQQPETQGTDTAPQYKRSPISVPFSGHVIERTTPPTRAQSASESPRKVSKFKASRQRK